MAMKFKITASDFEKLTDDQKANYTKKGETYVLDIEGADDNSVAGLLKKVDELLGEKKGMGDRLAALENAKKETDEAARKAAEEAAAKKGDVEALRKSVDERVAAAKAEVEAALKPQIDRAQGGLRKHLVDRVALELATKIGIKGSEAVLVPHIKNRLDVEERDGEYVTVVRDANGKPSAFTVDDLGKELSGNAAFAPVIAGSKASGGGAGGAKGGGAAGAKSIKRADFEALDAQGRVAHLKDGGTITD